MKQPPSGRARQNMQDTLQGCFSYSGELRSDLNLEKLVQITAWQSNFIWTVFVCDLNRRRVSKANNRFGAAKGYYLSG